jgi:hypothetical protein
MSFKKEQVVTSKTYGRLGRVVDPNESEYPHDHDHLVLVRWKFGEVWTDRDDLADSEGGWPVHDYVVYSAPSKHGKVWRNHVVVQAIDHRDALIKRVAKQSWPANAEYMVSGPDADNPRAQELIHFETKTKPSANNQSYEILETTR